MKLAAIAALGILALSANPSVAFELNWADVIPTVRPCTQQPTFHGYPYCVEKGNWQDKDQPKDRGVSAPSAPQSPPEPAPSRPEPVDTPDDDNDESPT